VPAGVVLLPLTVIALYAGVGKIVLTLFWPSGAHWWAVAASGHQSFSSAERRAIMPRAVWLLTAPRLMPMVAAISASFRSA